MFGVPLWVIGIIIQVLSKLGFFNLAQRLAIQAGMKVVHVVENAKVEYTYPAGRNGQTSKTIYAKGPANGNFNRGGDDDKSDL